MSYGYAGDSTPDSNSLEGIGAFPWTSAPGSLIDGYSVALKRSEAEQMGLHPGDEFEYKGRTVRWDDVQPEWGAGGVDVYEPHHAPDGVNEDEITRQREMFDRVAYRPQESEPSLSDEEFKEKYEAYYPNYQDQGQTPAAEEEKPKQEISPLDKLRSSFPAFEHLSDPELIEKLGQSFPEVPKDKLAVFAKQPDGAKLIQEEMTKGLSPLEKFKRIYPKQAQDKTDDQIIDYLHQKLDPQMPLEEFKQKVNPPSGPWNAVAEASKAGMDFFFDPSKFGTIINNGKLSPMGQGVVSGLQGFFGKGEAFPKAATDWFDALFKLSGTYGWEKQASGWLRSNVPAYAGADDYFRKFVNDLNTRGQEFNKQAAQQAASIPKDPASQVQGVIGQVIGSIPDQAVSFGLGSTGRAAALFGMTWDGVSAYGAAVENQQKNALAQGVSAAGFRQFASYLMNTGKGRLVIGAANSIATMAEEEIGKWLRGEPNDITKDWKHAIVGFVMGVFMGGHTKPAPYKSPFTKGQLEGTEVVQPSGKPLEPLRGPDVEMKVEAQKGDVISVQKPPERTNEQIPADAAAHTMKPLGYHAAVRLKNGEIFKGVDHGSALDNATQNGSIRVTDQTTTFGFVDRDGKFVDMDQADRILHEARQSKVTFNFSEPVNEELAKAKEHYENGDADKAADHIDRGLALMTEPEKQGLAKEFADKVDEVTTEAKDVKKEAKPGDQFNDYYYAGIPLQSFKAMREDIEKIGKGFRATFRPEKYSPKAEEAGAIIKAEEARSRAAQATIPAEIARRNKIENDLKFGDSSIHRERYFTKKSDYERQQELMDYQDGRPLKDPIANAIWEKVYRPVYDMLDQREKAYGVEHEVRENYFQQLFSHPKDEQVRLLEDVKRAEGGPAYTKKRLMTYREHVDRGDKPVTTNPERMMQIRWWASEQAIQKIRDMRQLEAQGQAYDTKLTSIPARVKERWPQQSTANGESWYVNPEITPVLNNKFGYNHLDLYKTWAGPYFKTLAFLKGGTAGLLSWSLFHPLHILDIVTSDISADAYMRRTHGVATVEDRLNEASNLVPWASGLAHGTRNYLRYADPVSALKGRVDLNKLSAKDRADIKDFTDMGLTVHVNEERMMQFTEGLARVFPQFDHPLAKMGARAVGWAWDKATAGPFTRWWFGEVTPRLKFASAMMRRDTLMRTRPELFKPSNRMELLKEFQNIHRDIEGRFGEMDYNNLLWPRWAKQVGQTHLLALGWQLGMLRTMGDGVVDLTTNIAHWDQIVKGTKNLRDIEKKAVTNRMAFEAGYAARAGITGLAITKLVGGVVATTLAEAVWDMFYPRVGKDKNGKDMRVNMQFFTKDVPAIDEYIKQAGSIPGGLMHFGMNKMNPMAMTVFQAMLNKDFMGRKIGQLSDQIAYVLKQMAPISLQNILAGHFSPTEISMDILGYSPSGRWTMRTSLENEIMDRAYSPDHHELTAARDAYRTSFLNHDQHGMAEARKELHRLKVDDQGIKKIEKDAHLSSAEKAWRHLSKADKEEMLQKMNPQERKYWLERSSKPINEDMKKVPIHKPSGYYAPRHPQEALTLAPGTHFRDPVGNIRMVPQNA